MLKKLDSLPLRHWLGLVSLLAISNLAQAQTATPAVVTVHIDATKTYQTIANFAASDAWACQFVGNWPAAKKEAIADLLFSTEAGPGGQPKGIGLSMWRVNLGAGSAEQGEASGIKDEWRRAESFLTPAGTYDWERLAGQRWFMAAARKRGVTQFLGFLNSPPVSLTRNGKAYATAKQPNLAPEKFGALADYCARIVAGVRQKTGITFDYLSPVNEPQWDWSDGGQEGTPFQNDDIAGIAKALGASLTANKLSTQILLAEAGKLDYLFTAADKPGRGDQIGAFFANKAAPTYLGSTLHVAPIMAGHSYFTTSPQAQAVATRQQLASRVASVPRLAYWQSEYCILGDNAGEINGGPRDLGMAPALYLARVIHTDLTVANAAAWQWWLAISPYDYKDGLVYIDKSKTDGQYYPSKMLWALGNYSRFVRPGAVRLAAHLDGAASPTGPLVSAYRSADGKHLITVVVNGSDAPASLRLELTGRKIGASQPYATSAAGDLQPGPAVAAGQAVPVAPRSITTLVSALR
ncbi:glycoside hydrolase family 30 protein [Hymenobacter ginsengisoli]|uniref:Glycoside hydrolase family 30 protein n=1 Tax=Hymenobacter ginsengisoli TaxID=1051626 RepID=A0ABP8PZ75_9BACT|nr:MULTISPECIES: glycoside hydrolase [unclassified Hymenobacter]MBO2030388.1 xylanase [Hymenobacter sp. BT559]